MSDGWYGTVNFDGCSKLTNVFMSNRASGITSQGFRKCKNLTSIIIPNRIQYIGAQTFMDCTSLKSVSIGRGVTQIGDYAFCNCTSLEQAVYQGSQEEWANVYVGTNNQPLTNILTFAG